MKKMMFLLAMLGLCFAVPVTFEVDLSDDPLVAAENTIALQGSFAGWWPGIIMDDADGDLLFSVTVDLEPGTYEYKFAGYEWTTTEFPDWSVTEDEAGPCLVVTNCTGENGACEFINRFVDVPDTELIINPVCWASCDACVGNPYGLLTNGGFENDLDGWGGDHNASWAVELTGNLVHNSEDYFEAYEGDYGLKTWGRFDGTPNNEFSQEFIINNETEISFTGWVFSHPDDPIGEGNTAYLTLSFTNDLEEDLGVFQSLVFDHLSVLDVWTELAVTATSPVGATSVSAAINYNQTLNADGSVYWDSLILQGDNLDIPGCMDPEANNYNPLATFDDGSCIYPGDYVYVTFNLDMSCEGDSPDPYLAGGGTFGNPGDNPMTDSDGDNIWTITVELLPNSSTDYTFTNGACGDWSCKENITGQDCAFGDYDDRHLEVGNEDMVINTCFAQCVDGSCSDCGDPITGCLESEIEVTFYVDVSANPEIPEEHVIALQGDFAGWWPGIVMDQFDEFVYGTSVCLQPETYYTYKFAGYEWTIAEFPDGAFEIDNPPCPETTFTEECQYGTCTNRFITTGTESYALEAVAWAGCETYPFTPMPSVTFQVDLSQNPEVLESGNQIALQADFADWWPGILMNDDDGDLIYEVTVQLEACYYEYKFAGYEWTANEFPEWTFTADNAPDCVVVENCTGEGGTCQSINRFVDVTENIVLDPFYWGTCDIPDVVPAVTFQVDMSQNIDIIEAGTQIALQSDFAGWWPGIPMNDDDGDLVYTVTVELEPGSYEYKFAGYEWAANEFPDWILTEDEALAAGCLIVDNCVGENGECQYINRFVDVTDSVVLDEVCWSSCDDCPGGVPDEVNVVFQVDMRYVDASTGVYIAGGTIGSEDPGVPSMGWQMLDEDEDDVFTITLPLNTLSHQNFKYRIGPSYDWGGLWEEVPAECGEGTYVDRWVDVGITDMVLDVVCFASCEACDDEPPVMADVTFQVDMSAIEVSSEGVFLHASFDGWGSIPMIDDDEDCIFSVTVPDMAVGGVWDYLYINGSTTEAVPNSCLTGINDWGGGVNRQFVVPDVDTIMEPVCFSMCEGDVCEGSCGSVDPVEVTFNVDMNCSELETFTSVYITGPGVGWCGDCWPMTDDDGDGIWTAVYLLDPGDFEYKYEVDNWTYQEDLVDDMQAGGECAPVTDYETFANRLITVPEIMATNDTYGSCTECDTCGDGDVTGDLTVDILDVVLIVGVILETVEDIDPDFLLCHGDVDESGAIDILDVVLVIDWILNGMLRENQATEAVIIPFENGVKLAANGTIGGIQIELSHGSDFSIELSEEAYLGDYVTSENSTTLILLVPGEQLFTTNGEFKIEEVIAVSVDQYVNVVTVDEYALLSNHPNPFNPSTNIDYSLPVSGMVNIAIYDILGKRVNSLVNQHSEPGIYSVTWKGMDDNGQPAPSGIYFIRMQYDGGVSSQKIMLLK